MRVRFLGTSAGNPDPQRMTSATLIEGRGGALLLDAGEGCSQYLQRPDSWSQKVRSILITHRHVDHIAGLFMLLSGYKGRRRTPLDIHIHPDLMAVVKPFCDTLHLGNDDQQCELSWLPLSEGDFHPTSGHVGEVWRNDHLPPDDLGGAHSLALDLDGARWVFSGDIGSFDSLEPYLDDTRVLVLESRHVNVEQAVQRARERGVESVVLTHIGRELKPYPLEGAIWAEDNMVVDSRNM